MPTRDAILEVLRQVEDPDLHRDIVALDFVRNLEVKDGRVAFDLQLTTPACPVKDQLKARCEELVRALPGVVAVEVRLSAQVRSPRPEGGIMPGVKNVVAVASGKGGVGKSTTAANLALSLAAEGASVGLLDGDIYGPSLPTMFGTKARPQPAGDKRIHPVYAQGLKLMSIGFLVEADTPMVWKPIDISFRPCA